jgi:hypothetical protein
MDQKKRSNRRYSSYDGSNQLLLLTDEGDTLEDTAHTTRSLADY